MAPAFWVYAQNPGIPGSSLEEKSTELQKPQCHHKLLPQRREPEKRQLISPIYHMENSIQCLWHIFFLFFDKGIFQPVLSASDSLQSSCLSNGLELGSEASLPWLLTTLHKFLPLSVPQFPPKNGGNNNTHFIELCGLKKLICVKLLELSLCQSNLQ